MAFVDQHFAVMIDVRKVKERKMVMLVRASGEEDKHHLKEYWNDVVLAVFRSAAIFIRVGFPCLPV